MPRPDILIMEYDTLTILKLGHRAEQYMTPIVTPFWDKTTGSWQYVVYDPATMKGAIIDPVLDFDAKAGAISTDSARALLEFVLAEGIKVEWILDTHPHADHFSAAQWLSDQLGGVKRGIGEKVTGVQRLWAKIYNTPDLPVDGQQWDHLFADDETFKIGEMPVRVIFSPGHTLASVSYLIGDACFVHDTFMMPDVGTSRADFPGGSSADLYDTLMRILALPDDTRLYVGHDYADGREAQCMATVAEQRSNNKHLHDGPDKETYQERRDGRDATLPLPNLMLAALQVNIRGGCPPRPKTTAAAT